MSIFSGSSVQLVKEAADIVEVISGYVQLRKKGANYQGLCPFHSEKTPSFSVNPSKQFYHCFGCKESGDVFSFLMKYENLTFQEALENLANRYGITLSRKNLTEKDQERLRQKDALFKLNSQASLLYHNFLLKQAAATRARNYLKQRGISHDLIVRYQLGYAPPRWNFFKDHLSRLGTSLDAALDAGLIVRNDKGRTYDRFRDRIIFPIFAMDGRVAGFGGRLIGEGGPKYLNSPETAVFDKSRLLYGLYQTRDAIRNTGKCLVVEGNFDLLTLVEQGLDYVVAPLGTALTRQHVQSIKRYAREATILFDGDAAGRKAAMNSTPLFLTEKLPAKIVPLPQDEDPDSFIKRLGQKKLEKRIKEASSLPEFVFNSLAQEYGLSLEGKNRIIENLAPLIKNTGNNQLQQSLFISHFSDKLGLSTAEMQRQLLAYNRPQAPSANNKKADAELPVQERQLLEFLLAYPDMLPRLLEAGMTRVCCHQTFMDIVKKMEDLDFKSGSPEMLLDVLEGQSYSLISNLLFTASFYPEESKETIVQEMEQWLLKKTRQNHKKQLIAKISEAQQKGDDELLLKLLKEKKKADENNAEITAS
ncbi:MAG: DNA primase [Thermodesulfobacteriota bacterium]